MNISPEDRQTVLEMAADKIVARISAEMPDIASLVSVPIEAAKIFTGLSATQVRRRLKPVKVGRRMEVTIRNIINFRKG